MQLPKTRLFKSRLTAAPGARVTALSLLIVSSCLGQAPIDNLQAIVRDTQKSASIPHQISLVWWLPEQFWQASLQRSSSSQIQAERILGVVRRYTLIAVVDGRIGPFGGVTYTTGDAIRKSITIKDSKGESYLPLDDSALDPDMKNMIQLFRPTLANMLGGLGQNLNFFVFPPKTKAGRLLADATKEGSLEVIVDGASFKYRLPLGSVLPPQYDPTTGETFPGNYKFNPYTGDKLTNESPKKETH